MECAHVSLSLRFEQFVKHTGLSNEAAEIVSIASRHGKASLRPDASSWRTSSSPRMPSKLLPGCVLTMNILVIQSDARGKFAATALSPIRWDKVPPPGSSLTQQHESHTTTCRKRVRRVSSTSTLAWSRNASRCPNSGVFDRQADLCHLAKCGCLWDKSPDRSKRSNHDPCVGPASARLALALCALVEHVAQNIVVAVFVHVMNAHVSVQSQPSSTSLFARSKRTYRCRLSGRGYLCSRSGQNGHT
jgi:hypothetical protein